MLLLRSSKVFVLFPYKDGTYGQKTFKVNNKEWITVHNNNADYGCLIVIANNEPKDKSKPYETRTLAVFRDWIYWQALDE